MKYEVDGWNNFCRVFEVPEKFPRGYCFGGGLPATFTMVDWFNPIIGISQPAVTKEVWRENVGEIEIKIVENDDLANRMREFLSQKNYVKPGRTYLVLCDFGMAFTFKKDSTGPDDCDVTPTLKPYFSGVKDERREGGRG